MATLINLPTTKPKILLTTSSSSRFVYPSPKTVPILPLQSTFPRKFSSEFSGEPSTILPPPPSQPFSSNQPRKGAEIIVQSLELEGVTNVFVYPTGDSMEIHQALTRSASITNHLLHHEQGEIFAAEGYAQSTGRTGVCISTYDPGTTNLVSGLADALVNSVPLVAICAEVPCRMIGTDAFQETPIVEVTRPITKHNYLVLDVEDIPGVIKEAFFLARSGRPGPVLVYVPKDIQQQLAVPCFDPPMQRHGYLPRFKRYYIEHVLRAVGGSRRPMLYVGGGCVNAWEELRRFVELTGIPVASTLMGLGVYPTDGDLSLKMLGMYGTVHANYAMDKCDLLLAFGVRFDDKVIGNLEDFASRAKIFHIDIDPTEIGKNKQPHLSICADMKLSLEAFNSLIEETGLDKRLNFSMWKEELDKQKKAHPLSYKEFAEAVPPQYAIQMLDELTNGQAIISTGVGQHQMWAAQYYTYKKPHQWLTSVGLRAKGFGLPAAAGAAVGNPGVVVVDIDGDGSFLMNVQELAMIRKENLPVKVMVLNNQHLGMVVQWEDHFYKANRAHTFLGDPSNEKDIYPDLVAIAKGFNIPGARVSKKSQVRQAIKEMLETPGPYLLDVVVPHQEHVLPMIPSGGAFKDIITEGDGRTL